MAEYRSTLLEVNGNFASTEMEIMRDGATEGAEVLYVNILDAQGELVTTLELSIADTSLDYQASMRTLSGEGNPLLLYSMTVPGTGYRTSVYPNTGEMVNPADSFYPPELMSQFGTDIIEISEDGNTIVLKTGGPWDAFTATILTRDGEGKFSIPVPMSAPLGYSGNSASADLTPNGDYLIFTALTTYLGLYKLEGGQYVRKSYGQFTPDWVSFYGVELSPDGRRFVIGADSNYSLYGGYINGDVLSQGSTRVSLPDYNLSNIGKAYVWLSDSRVGIYRDKTDETDLTNIHIYDVSPTGVITFVSTIVKNKRYALFQENKIPSPTVGRIRMMARINGDGGIVEIDTATGDIVAEVTLPYLNDVPIRATGFFSSDGSILNAFNYDSYPIRFNVGTDLTVTQID